MSRALEALGRRIGLLIARGILRLIDDTTGVQIVQGSFLEGEVRSQIERIQRYGFTSVPMPGTEFVGLFPNGSRSVGFAIADDERETRKKNLGPGEVAVYHRDGVTFCLLKTGEVQIMAGTKLHLEAPTVEIVASAVASIAAPLISLSGSTSVVITTPLFNPQAKGDYKLHVHGGITPGGSNTLGVT